MLSSMTRSPILWCAILVACDRAAAAPDRDEVKSLTATIGVLDARIKALEAQFRDPSPLLATRSPVHWWCHAGHSTCFRDRSECAAKHAQGLAGCEPRRIAYCCGTACSADLDVCQMDLRSGRYTNFCIGVE
jgi:hypothetical protein